MLQREQLCEFFQGKDFLLGARIPTEKCQHVDEGFGEIAVFFVSVPFLAGGGVGEFHGEHGEAHFVTVAFAEFAIAHGLQNQRQVGEPGHGVFPSESPVEQHVQGQ